MMPPSTYRAPPSATTSPIARVVAGETALPSTYVPPKPSAATSRAMSIAFAGGQTDRITSLCATSCASVPASSRPADCARLPVAGLRPPDTHNTRAPPTRAASPTTLPISPGWSSPIVLGIPVTSSMNCRRCRSSADDAPAHHADRVAGDVRGRVGGEKETRLRDVLGAAEAPERNPLELSARARRRLPEFRIPLGVPSLGVDVPRQHGVGADAERPELCGQRAHEP